jgi:hypothetical protein
MKKETEHFLGQLGESRWFSAVGQQVDEPDTIIVSSWSEALASDEGEENWADVRMKAADCLCEAVAAIDKQRLRKFWNPTVEELRPTVFQFVKTKVVEVIGDRPFCKVVTDLAQWDILHACMGHEHFDIIQGGFYFTLGSWYVRGHFPCEWKGAFPEGKLVVY